MRAIELSYPTSCHSVIGDPTSSNTVEHQWMHTDLQCDYLLYKNAYPYKLNAKLPQTLLISSKWKQLKANLGVDWIISNWTFNSRSMWVVKS